MGTIVPLHDKHVLRLVNKRSAYVRYRQVRITIERTGMQVCDQAKRDGCVLLVAVSERAPDKAEAQPVDSRTLVHMRLL